MHLASVSSDHTFICTTLTTRSTLCAVVLVALACGKEPTAKEPLTPYELQIAGGDGQEGTVDQALSTPLRVRVVARSGEGVRDVQLHWTSDAGTISRIGRTDAQGYATATWRLGTVAGEQHLTVSFDGLAPRVFIAHARPGVAASVRIDAGLFMLASGATRQLTAQAADQFGNALSPNDIAWRSTDAAVASVGATGLVTAKSRGQAGAIATLGAAADTAYLKVDEIAWASIAVGRYHSCGLSVDGQLMCWGQNAYGELGDGGISPRSIPAPVVGGRTYIAVSAAWSHTCAIAQAGDISCWGDNPYGKWDASAADRLYEPTRLESAVQFEKLSVDVWHGCALAVSGDAYCWGNRLEGNLGDGIAAYSQFSAVPVAVVGGHRFRQLSAGNATCGVAADSATFCWGKLGSTDDPGSFVPRPMSLLPDLSTVSVNLIHACGVGAGGQGFCWGNDEVGQLGNGPSYSGSMSPVLVGGGVYAEIQAIELYSCGRTQGGALYCWGAVPAGASSVSMQSPTLIAAPEPVAGLAGNTFHFCIVSVQGNAYCQGNNIHGQLGDGTTEPRSAFVRVKDPQ